MKVIPRMPAPRHSPRSSMPSPSSRRASEEVVDVEWTEVAGSQRSGPSDPARPLEPPIDLAARARGRSREGSPRGARGKGSEHAAPPRRRALPPAAPCVFCQGPSVTAIPLVGPLAVPLCDRCERLSSAALNLLR